MCLLREAYAELFYVLDYWQEGYKTQEVSLSAGMLHCFVHAEPYKIPNKWPMAMPAACMGSIYRCKQTADLYVLQCLSRIQTLSGNFIRSNKP